MKTWLLECHYLIEQIHGTSSTSDIFDCRINAGGTCDFYPVAKKLQLAKFCENSMLEQRG